MRTLIDGYNLMFADGLPAKRPGTDAFRKARQRFLDKLAGASARSRRPRRPSSSTPPTTPPTSPP